MNVIYFVIGYIAQILLTVTALPFMLFLLLFRPADFSSGVCGFFEAIDQEKEIRRIEKRGIK